MKPRTFLLGALAYLLVTFPLASVWHLVIFKDTYQWLGMYREDPSVPLGFFVILIQGLLLSHVFPLFQLEGGSIRQGLKFGLFMGLFLWSSQVVAAAAKHHVASIPTWLAIETAYFAIQFTLVGLAIGFVFSGRGPSAMHRPRRLHMAYDDKLADRIRTVLKRRRGVTERKMFGGLAFLLNGNMCCGVLKKDLVLRLGKDRATKALDKPYAREMDFTGRALKSMVYIGPAGYRTEAQLRRWVGLGLDYVKSLPAK